MKREIIKNAFYRDKKWKEEIFGKIHILPISKIYPNPNQPRKNFEDDKILKLAESIVKYGILQPICVRLASDLRIYSEKTPIMELNYELIAGERRLRAAKIAGYGEVPCIIVDADGRRSAELSIIENLQRENLNIFEEAGAIGTLIDAFSFTQEQAARMLGMSQSTVANKLRLLKLTSVERRIIVESGLTERHARALLKISDPDIRIKLLDTIIKKDLNVSDSEALIDRFICNAEKNEQAAKRKTVIKDFRIFYNSIDRAIDIMEKAGIGVAKTKRENEDTVELVIRINKFRREKTDEEGHRDISSEEFRQDSEASKDVAARGAQQEAIGEARQYHNSEETQQDKNSETAWQDDTREELSPEGCLI